MNAIANSREFSSLDSNDGKILDSFIIELKTLILKNQAALAQSKTTEGCHIQNRMSAELYSLTGEVFSCGQFIKVA